MDIKVWLTQYNIKTGYGTTDADLIETLLEAKRIEEKLIDHHRWYDTIYIVVKVEDKYIRYMWYSVRGDDSISDMGLPFEWNTVKEVEPVEELAIVYKPVKK